MGGWLFVLVKRAGHLWCFLKITPNLAEETVSSFAISRWEGVWASSRASSKREGAFWLPSFIVICSPACCHKFGGDVGRGCHSRCCAHQRCETISGFYFGSLESLEEVLALCLHSAKAGDTSANDNQFWDFKVFIIIILLCCYTWWCISCVTCPILLLFLVEKSHVDTFLWTH